MATVVEFIIRGKNESQKAINQVTDGLGDIAKAGDKTSTSLVGGFKKIGTAAFALTTGALAGLAIGFGKFAKEGIADSATLEQQMADTASVLGKTLDELEPLEDLLDSLAVNPDYVVGMDDAAAATEMLARNGVDLEGIMDGALESVIAMSNATGGDMALAADVATDAMAQFGIESGNMIDAVDTITGVTANSKINLQSYAFAIGQGGAAAASAGLSFADFNTILAAITPNFRGGSEAGTGLRNMLNNLIPKSQDATDAMRELGLFTGLTDKEFEKVEENIAKTEQQISDLDPTSEGYQETLGKLNTQLTALESSLKTGQNAFFDQNGELKSGIDISNELTKAFEGLTEQQRLQNLQTIFGIDGAQAALGLINTSTDAYQALSTEINENTSAQDAAATRTDTLVAVWGNFLDILESVRKQIFDRVTPTLKDLLNNLNPIVQAIGTEVVAAVDRLIAGLQDGVGFFQLIKNEFVNIYNSLSINTESTFGRIVAFVRDTFIRIRDHVTRALGFIQSFWDDHGQRLVENVTFYFNLVRDAIAVRLQFLRTLVGGALSIMRTFWERHGEDIQAAWGRATGGLKETATTFAEFYENRLQNMLNNLTAFWEEHGDTIMKVMADVLVFIGNVVRVGAELWSMIGEALTALVEGDFEGFLNYLRDYARRLWDVIRGVFQSIDWGFLGRSIISGIINGIGSMAGMLMQAAQQAGQAALTAIQQALGIFSPSRVFEAEVGMQISAGIAQGILAGQPMIAAASQEAAGTAVAAGTTVNNFNTTNNISARRVDMGREPLTSFAVGSF